MPRLVGVRQGAGTGNIITGGARAFARVRIEANKIKQL